jgi:ABC-type dipeptide/oligopeptide/nickel transport system permease component
MRASFLRRRLLSSLSAVFGVSVLVFLLVHLIPGDPVDNLLGERADPIDKVEMRRCMDLDQPLVVQFGRFLKNVADGSLGHTCPDRRRTVASLIVEALPSTVALATSAMVVALILALPLGILAALRPRSALDAAATVISLAGISMPAMWLGPLLLAIFYVGLQWLPGPADDRAGLAGLVLPSFMLGTHLMAMLARMTRSSLLEVLGEDYVRTARAKGVPERGVIWKHTLRNALIPVITLTGLQFGFLLGGAIVVETVFAWPGLGRLLVDSVAYRDYPVIQAEILLFSCEFVLINLIVDLLYAVVNPEIRLR